MNKHIGRYRFAVIILASVLSFGAWWISVKTGYAMLYNDAMAHVNLSRIVIDNLKPGITQLGGVWLPLNQILYLFLVWNNWAWHTGFAGSIVSMICYILSVYIIFETVYYASKNILAGLVGALVFAINVNILYLQSTPLTEPLFLFLFILSFYFFIRWIAEKKASHLITVALIGFPLVLSRYDGWFVMIMELAIVLLYVYLYQKKGFFNAVSIAIVFSLPFMYGIFLWLIWNKLIFGRFLFFALGPYSAHAQQAVLSASNGGLLAKGNLWFSLLSYFYTVKDNVGTYVLILAGIGGLMFFLSKNKLSPLKRVVIMSFLFSPVIFNILALYFGFSIVNVPDLHWKPSFDRSGIWFNVRYGILALPIVAVLIGYIIGKSKNALLSILIIAIIFAQSYSFLRPEVNIATLTDGLSGSSKFQNQDVANYLHRNVTANDKVLLSLSYFSPVAFRSGIEMDQVIHEGTSTYWTRALNYPYVYPKWIVMANGNVGDPVYTALVNKQRSSFLALYKVAYQGVHANVYERRTTNDVFIRSDKSTLMAGTQPYRIVGVNSYDLAYTTEEKMRENFSYFRKMGANTVRFWAFGDGLDNGFQPKAGITNEERLRRMDYLLTLAKANSIRVVPVLVNNWTDYGGKAQYVAWIGQDSEDAFYTNPSAVSLFKNYVNKIISRKNTYSGIEYKDDPTILAWEIMNEPRSGDANNGDSDILRYWSKDMGTYVKSLDSNHLVSMGTETIALCSVSSIDLCSVHLYVENQGEPRYPSLSAVTDYTINEARLAKLLMKPIYVGEIGIRKSYQVFDQEPLSLLRTLVASINHEKYAGFLVWDWSLRSDESFGFSPEGNSGVYSLTDLVSVIHQKTSHVGSKAPITNLSYGP